MKNQSYNAFEAKLIYLEELNKEPIIESEKANKPKLPIDLNISKKINIIIQNETILDRKISINKENQEVPETPRLCDSMQSTEKGFIDIDGCKIYYEREKGLGNGPPIVLIHGGPGGTHHYFHQNFSKAKEFSSKIIYYDQRGCGLSGNNEGYSNEMAINDLEVIRKKLDIEKWIVLGHSYGGLIAQNYALYYPDSTAGLALVCAEPCLPLEDLGNQRESFLSEQEIKRISEIDNNDELSLEQKLYNRVLNGDWKRQGMYKPSKERMAQMALYEWQHDEQFRDQVCYDEKNINLEEAFNNCPIPTIIMEGKWDATWGNKKSEVLHQAHPNSNLEIFNNSAHNPFDDEPATFFEKLKEFSSTCSSSQISINQWKNNDLKVWLSNKDKLEKETPIKKLLKFRKDYMQKLYEQFQQNNSIENILEINDPEKLLEFAAAFYVNRQFNESLAILKKLIKLDPKDTFQILKIYLWYGHINDILGNRSEAIKSYQKISSLNIAPEIHDDIFDIDLDSEYAKTRLKEPFQPKDFHFLEYYNFN